MVGAHLITGARPPSWGVLESLKWAFFCPLEICMPYPRIWRPFIGNTIFRKDRVLSLTPNFWNCQWAAKACCSYSWQLGRFPRSFRLCGILSANENETQLFPLLHCEQLTRKMHLDYFDVYILLLLIVEISFEMTLINPLHPCPRSLFTIQMCPFVCLCVHSWRAGLGWLLSGKVMRINWESRK